MVLISCQMMISSVGRYGLCVLPFIVSSNSQRSSHAVHYLCFNSESEMMIQSEHGWSCLPDRCSMMCGLADSRVMASMQRIMDGKITLKEMENVKEKRSRVEKLCLANQDYDVEKVKAALEHREKECNALKQRKKVLASFCSEMDTAKLKIDGSLCVKG